MFNAVRLISVRVIKDGNGVVGNGDVAGAVYVVVVVADVANDVCKRKNVGGDIAIR